MEPLPVDHWRLSTEIKEAIACIRLDGNCECDRFPDDDETLTR
jgi:hypothetical protein